MLHREAGARHGILGEFSTARLHIRREDLSKNTFPIILKNGEYREDLSESNRMIRFYVKFLYAPN